MEEFLSSTFSTEKFNGSWSKDSEIVWTDQVFGSDMYFLNIFNDLEKDVLKYTGHNPIIIYHYFMLGSCLWLWDPCGYMPKKFKTSKDQSNHSRFFKFTTISGLLSVISSCEKQYIVIENITCNNKEHLYLWRL